MKKEVVIVGIIILLLICMNVSGNFVKDKMEASTTSFDGNTLYVGGSGPNNYTMIQSAIDDAVDGDTVFVYDESSPYNEQLIIRKSISLLGENKLTTKIDKLVIIIIDVKTENFKFSGFTVQGGEIGIYGVLNNSLITDNIFLCFCTGIGLDETSSNNIISDNMFNVSEQYGSYVIGLFGSDSNTITNNIIKQGTKGLWLYGARNNRIYGNTISDNTWQGINMSNCFLNYIGKNNFINNANQVTFEDSSFNLWWRNYWDDCSKSFLYPITGTRYNILTDTTSAWTTYDWIPAKEPYDI